MQDRANRNRWVFVVVLLTFLIFRQLTGYLIEPISTQFRALASIGDYWFDTDLPVHLLVAMVFFIVWGILFDSHSRKKLMSLAGFLWGVSAWLMGFAPTYATFNISRAASGVDFASHSGIYAMVGDLYKPINRGKIIGLLLLSQPLAYLVGMVLPNYLDDLFKSRITLAALGAIGFILAIVIHFFIEEPKRGAKEPALANINMTGTYQFDWEIAKTALKKPSLLLIYAISLVGTIPWFMLMNGLPIYLRDVHFLQVTGINQIILPSIMGVTLGYPLSGFVGDLLFRYKKSGRIIVSLVGVVLPCICLFTVFQTQDVDGQTLTLCMKLVGFFMAFSWPSLIASILDITLPELRASANALALLCRSIGMMISPFLLSLFRAQMGLGNAILWTCIGSWVICAFFLIGMLFYIPRDIEQLRRHMAYRSHLEARFARSNAR